MVRIISAGPTIDWAHKASQTGWSCLQKNLTLTTSARGCREMQSKHKQLCFSGCRSVFLPFVWVPGKAAFASHSHFARGMSRKTECVREVSAPKHKIKRPIISKGFPQDTRPKENRLNIRRNVLRLWCIKLWDQLPRGAVGAVKPATYSTVKRPIGASMISAQGSCTESSTMPFATPAPKNQTQEVQRKEGKQWCQFAKETQAFLHYCMS